MKQVDVERIIREIRKEIKEKGYTSDLLSFTDSCIADGINMAEILDLSYYTKTKAEIDEYPKWQYNSIFDRIKVFIKKAIRKSMKFYIVPIVEKQNMYNDLVSDRLLDLCKIVLQQEDEILKMKKEISALEKKCTFLEEKIRTSKE